MTIFRFLYRSSRILYIRSIYIVIDHILFRCERKTIDIVVFLSSSGPATVRMISENGPTFPLPLHLPPGHMVQQILDENGVLTHVIMSQPGPLPPPPPPHHHLVSRTEKKRKRDCSSYRFSIPVILLLHTMDFMVIHINITIPMSMDPILPILYHIRHVQHRIIHLRIHHRQQQQQLLV